jgi:hypothetical protein
MNLAVNAESIWFKEQEPMKSQDTKMKNIVAYNFDWDDNIMIMSTKILLFHKKTNRSKAISTKEFAIYRESVGKAGKYQNYRIYGEDKYGNPEHPDYHSFINFRDDPKAKPFVDQVKEAIKKRASFGPSFGAFCASLNDRKTARWTTIITARGHHPKSIMEALKFLQKKGYIKYLPLLKHIFPVSHPKFKGHAEDPSMTKVNILFSLMDLMDKESILKEGKKIRMEDGKSMGYKHVCGFSDDDFKTFETACKELKKEYRKRRWKNIKVVLYYTGLSGTGPHEYIFTKKGYREMSLPERRELGIYEPNLKLSK